MSDSIKEALSGAVFINKVAEMYGVPRSIHKDRLSVTRVVHVTKPGPRPYLTLTRENGERTTKLNRELNKKKREEERKRKRRAKKLEKDEKKAERNGRRAYYVRLLKIE